MTKEQLIDTYSNKYHVSKAKVKEIYEDTYAKLKAENGFVDRIKFFSALNAYVTNRVKQYAAVACHVCEYVPKQKTEAIACLSGNVDVVKEFVGNSSEFVFTESGFKFYYDEYVGWQNFRFGDYVVKTNGTLGAMTRSEFNNKFEKVSNVGNDSRGN